MGKIEELKVKAYDLSTKADALQLKHQELRQKQAILNKEITELEQGDKHGEREKHD